MRAKGYDVVDVTPELEDDFTGMVDKLARRALFNTSSYFFGGNIPGKPIKYLLNPGGRAAKPATRRRRGSRSAEPRRD